MAVGIEAEVRDGLQVLAQGGSCQRTVTIVLPMDEMTLGDGRPCGHGAQDQAHR